MIWTRGTRLRYVLLVVARNVYSLQLEANWCQFNWGVHAVDEIIKYALIRYISYILYMPGIWTHNTAQIRGFSLRIYGIQGEAATRTSCTAKPTLHLYGWFSDSFLKGRHRGMRSMWYSWNHFKFCQDVSTVNFNLKALKV